MRLLELNSARDWNEILLQLPAPHLLQTYEWGRNKIQNGWMPLHYIWEEDGKINAAALVLSRQVSLGLPGLRLEVLYCPKGPTLDWQNQALVERVLDDLQALAAKRRAAFIKIDPDVELGRGEPGAEDALENPIGQAFQQNLERRGWNFSDDQIQFRNTVMIDLTRSEEEILAAMKQKTRYNIRLAERKGVVVRVGQQSDLPALYAMYAATAARDDFVIRHEGYYLNLWGDFMLAGMAAPLIAEVDGQAVAGLILFHFAGLSRYMFGMSLDRARELMPNYLLQWEAIRLSRSLGCRAY
ncbi:MAG: peptidoglycan bridge formation glycyltransferase FemA/FemB family protein, partial [Anaerolineaceae bacterium]